VSIAVDFPNRRVEAWKYSDLRAVFADAPPPLRDGRDIIERLAPSTERVVVAAGESSSVSETLSASGLEVQAKDYVLERGATLNRLVVQDNPDLPLSIARISLAEGAKLNQIVLATGGRLARIETHIDVNGARAEVQLNSIYLAAKGRHADLTSVIQHHATGCITRQMTKGAVRAGGRGVVQGKIVVMREAQQTDARQYHHGLLLDEGAELFAKPELMIYADDVQCAHGNTAGALSDDALFYLRSRGIVESEARALLVEAHLADAIPAHASDDVRDMLLGRIRAWLGAGS
jgi:Fe-S cluster assembly protein SufD